MNSCKPYVVGIYQIEDGAPYSLRKEEEVNATLESRQSETYANRHILDHQWSWYVINQIAFSRITIARIFVMLSWEISQTCEIFPLRSSATFEYKKKLSGSYFVSVKRIRKYSNCLLPSINMMTAADSSAKEISELK